jgi:hypothetical protein
LFETVVPRIVRVPFGCGSGSDAGFQTRIDSYDRRIATDPPPFTPVVSTDYQFVDWKEE